MTHGSIPTYRPAAIGLSDSWLRVSAGIEDADDLIADLDQALSS
jgi:cystathionine gamma-lyase